MLSWKISTTADSQSLYSRCLHLSDHLLCNIDSHPPPGPSDRVQISPTVITTMRLRIPTILLYLPILIHADYPTLFGPPTESSDSSISSPTDGDYSTEPLTSGYPTRAASTSAATSVAQYLTEATLSESTEDITRTFDLETEFLFPGAQRMKDILYHDESYNVRWRPPSSRGPDSANGENEPATRFYGLGLAPIGSDTATTELEPLYEFFLYNNGSYWWTVDDTFRPGRWEMVMVDGHGGWAGPNARILALSGPFEIRESRAGSGTVEDSGENDSGVDETIEGVDGTEDDEEGAMREELERMKQEARKKEEDRQEEEQHKEQEKTQVRTPVHNVFTQSQI